MAEEKNSFNNKLNDFFYDGNTCPACKTGFTIHSSNAIYYGCSNCRSYVDISKKDNFRVVSVAKKVHTLSLPLGAKGVFKGTTYEVIAYTRCQEYKSIYGWNEYYLYNSARGFAYLSEYDGHWILLTELPSLDSNKASTLLYEGLEYQLYSKYKTQLIYAVGEFDFDIFSSELAEVREYIHPPYMVSYEQRGPKKQEFKGEYITPDEMKEAFADSKIKVSIPKRTGVGVIQPFARSYSMASLWTVTVLALLVLVIGHFVIVNLNGSDEIVFKQSFYIDDSTNEIPPIVSNSFTIPEKFSNHGNLEIELYAPVNQTWLETQINLINDETGQEYSVSTGVEYYSGYDDGAWSEGAQSGTIILSSIPAGTYHLNIFPFRDSLALNKTGFFALQIVRNTTMKANFFIILLLMLAFPIVEYWKYRRMENERWMGSNVS